MIKLSELSDDTMLAIEQNRSGDIYITDKEDYMYCFEENKNKKVFLAEKVIAEFDLLDILEDIGERNECYDGWGSNVYNELKDLPETKAFLEAVDKVFANNSTYYSGKPVEIDINPKSEMTQDE